MQFEPNTLLNTVLLEKLQNQYIIHMYNTYVSMYTYKFVVYMKYDLAETNYTHLCCIFFK